MSTERVIRIKAVDDTTPVLLGMARTIRAVGSELRLFRMLLLALAQAELISAQAATTLGLALKIAVPGIGLVAGLFGIMAAVQATQQRAIIPIGQTAVGQFRPILATGPIMAHAGEVIGRPQDMAEAGLAGPSITMYNTFILNSEGDSPAEVARKLALEAKRRFRSMTTD